MSFQVIPFSKKSGDKCPACYSTDVKRPKGILIKVHNLTGLKCTVCKFKHNPKPKRFRKRKGFI